jgi:hypothetical protein
MEFEFEPAKSASNLEKHGIDFGAVQAIWTSLRSAVPRWNSAGSTSTSRHG